MLLTVATKAKVYFAFLSPFAYLSVQRDSVRNLWHTVKSMQMYRQSFPVLPFEKQTPWQYLSADCRMYPHWNNTHTHTRLMALCLGQPRWAGTRKVKSIWILLEQEIVSGSGISWAVCKCAPRSRQITTPAPHYLVFTGRMPFLPPNQQCQSTEGTNNSVMYFRNLYFVALNWWNMTQSGAWHVVCNSGLLLVK